MRKTLKEWNNNNNNNNNNDDLQIKKFYFTFQHIKNWNKIKFLEYKEDSDISDISGTLVTVPKNLDKRLEGK